MRLHTFEDDFKPFEQLIDVNQEQLEGYLDALNIKLVDEDEAERR